MNAASESVSRAGDESVLEISEAVCGSSASVGFSKDFMPSRAW